MNLRKFLVYSLAIGLACLSVYTAYVALHSPFFLVKSVEIQMTQAHAQLGSRKLPLDKKMILDLTEITPGADHLLQISLNEIKNKIAVHPWIDDVKIQKKLPDMLSIEIDLKKPIALLQTSDQKLAYVGTDGKIFGEVDFNFSADIPLIYVKSGHGELKNLVDQSVMLLQQWQRAGTKNLSQISSITWDEQNGYQVMILYPLINEDRIGRSILNLGQKIDGISVESLTRLFKVIEYLAQKSILAHRIWLNDGKKIVVKTALSS